MSERCSTCGRGDLCQPCYAGEPPAGRLADLERERVAREQQKPEANPALVRSQLADIPDLYALLALYLEPGSLPPDPDARRATSSHARIPVVLDVIDLLDTRLKPQADDETGERDLELDQRAGHRRLGVLPTLGLWVSMVIAELADLGQDVIGCCPPHAHTVTGECSWLTRHLSEILELHEDFADDVAWMHRDLQRAVGESIRSPYQPRCPWCRDRVEGQGDTGVAWFKCRGCERTWTLAAEIRRLAATQPAMTLSQCADALGRPVVTVRRWVADSGITPVGVRAGAKVYDFDVVAKLADSIAPQGRPRRVV